MECMSLGQNLIQEGLKELVDLVVLHLHCTELSPIVENKKISNNMQ